MPEQKMDVATEMAVEKKGYHKTGYWLGAAVLLVLAVVLSGPLWWSASDTERQVMQDLPWQARLQADGSVAVFGLRIGDMSLREVSEVLKAYPELAVFADGRAGHEVRLEGYFGKLQLGLFEARIIAELKADPDWLQQIVSHGSNRKAQPSGNWRYTLNEQDVTRSSEHRVRYLIYLPAVNYESEVVLQRFGAPASRQEAADGKAFWFYPDQGLVIEMNTDGGEVLYYSSRQEWPALTARLQNGKGLTP
ncbi:MAG: hypothetical protein KDI44_18735 [Thiothrix sp.]|nr:hypothetical protein [Thiothrix sp.]HPQ94973.1 hypothetical protein [Thiolinea sp.]